MPEYMCQYGNCWETNTPIVVSVNNTDPKERVRFCSLAHLALWARDKIRRNIFASRTSVAAEKAKE